MKYFLFLLLAAVLAGSIMSSVAAAESARTDASLRGLDGLLNRLTETGKRVYGDTTVSGIDANYNFLESTIGRLINYALSMAGVALVGFLTSTLIISQS